MSKKIVIATINADSLDMISKFNQSIVNSDRINEEYKGKIKEAEAHVEDIRVKREEALKDGKRVDELSEDLNVDKALKDLNALTTERTKALSPYNDMRKTALESLDNNLYYAYLVFMDKGDENAKGKVQTGKGEHVKTVLVEKSLKTLVAEWLKSMGCVAQSDLALSKFAKKMAVRTGGMIKSRLTSKNHSGYIKMKSETQFKDLFLRAFLQEFVLDNRAFDVAEDGSLTLHDFSKDEQ